MINVLHIRDSGKVFGAERVIMSIVGADYNLHLNFTVASFVGKGREDNQFLNELKDVCDTAMISENRLFDLKIIHQLLQLIKKRDIDVIHSHDVKSNFYGLIAAKITKTPIISTVHGWISNSYKQKIYIYIDRILKKFFNKVIIVSQSQLNILRTHGVSEKNISYVPNSVSLSDFGNKNSSGLFRKELNLTPKNLLIGNIGRLSPEKGQCDFIEAAKIISEKYEEVRYILIGDGPDYHFLKDYTDQLKLTEKVIFAGYRKDITDVYSSLNLIVLSSYTEGMPNVILEAMAAEVPIIATRVGGVSELIENGNTGIMVDPGKPKELASAINHALSNPKLLMKLVKKAKKNIEEKFSVERNILLIHKIYIDLIK